MPSDGISFEKKLWSTCAVFRHEKAGFRVDGAAVWRQSDVKTILPVIAGNTIEERIAASYWGGMVLHGEVVEHPNGSRL